MIKVLSWDGHDGSFRLSEKDSSHPIRDISEDDVLSIMRLILEDANSIEMDPKPTDRQNANQAALVIYEELYKQFDQMVKKRDEVIERIDKQFERARSYYSQTDIDGLFDESASQELQPDA